MLFLLFATVYAQQPEYITLEPSLPGVGASTNLTEYIPSMFILSIGIAAVMAFVMITFGGIMYMTSDAISGKTNGKKYVTDALLGLLLVIGAYVILNTINPKILTINLTIPQPVVFGTLPSTTITVTGTTINVGGNIAGVKMSQAQIDADAQVYQDLHTSNSRISRYAGPCLQGQITGCVNFNGLVEQRVVSGLSGLASTCGTCYIKLSGGTEAGHTPGGDHDLGLAVDILPDDDLTATIIGGNTLVECVPYNVLGGKFVWEKAGSACGAKVGSSGDHWHVKF